MMDYRKMTPEQIRKLGLEILAREMGPDGMVMFLKQFEVGQGNYSEERHEWLDRVSINDLAKEIASKHKK